MGNLMTTLIHMHYYKPLKKLTYLPVLQLTFNSVQFSSPKVLNAPWLLIEMFTYKDTEREERRLVIYIAKSCCWGWDYKRPKEKSCHITNEWEVKFAKLAINLPIYIQNKYKLNACLYDINFTASQQFCKCMYCNGWVLETRGPWGLLTVTWV